MDKEPMTKEERVLLRFWRSFQLHGMHNIPARTFELLLNAGKRLNRRTQRYNRYERE